MVCEKPNFSVPDHPVGCTCGIGTSEKLFWNQDFFALCELLSHYSSGGFLRVPPKFSFKKLLLSTGLWQYTKMSTTLKSPDGLKDAECKKGQLSNWPPIPYVPVTDIVMPKEDPQVCKAKLPDDSHINMHINSRGNNEEYFIHIDAVLCIIKQRGLDSRCSRKLEKAILRQSKMLKNLLETAGSRDTVSMDIDVMARKVEIEQTQQLLQDFQKTHDKAIVKVYKQL